MSAMTRRFTVNLHTALESAYRRLSLQLRAAELSTPPTLYQMIEELRLVLAEEDQRTREGVQRILRKLGADEEEFLDWLALDIQLLEAQIFKTMARLADPTQLDLNRLAHSAQPNASKHQYSQHP